MKRSLISLILVAVMAIGFASVALAAGERQKQHTIPFASDKTFLAAEVSLTDAYIQWAESALAQQRPAISGIPVASTQPKVFEASAYPTQFIISGELTLNIPAVETRINAIDQKLNEGITTLSRSLVALGVLELLTIVGLVLGLCLIVSRTKVLKALGLSKLADGPPSGAAASGKK